MDKKYIYYTFQGDYTLEQLETKGYFASTIDNNYKLIDLVKHHFNSEGVVYYFKVSADIKEDLPQSGRNRHLIYLNGDTLSKNRIEFVGSKFSKAMLMCDSLCLNKFFDYRRGETSIDEIISTLDSKYGVNFDFFKEFGKGDSEVYVGLVDMIRKEDVLKIIKDYR